MLAGASETHNPRKLKMHNTGFELWVLLKNNFDRASTFNVISSLRCGRDMQAAKCVCVPDVMSKVNALKTTTPRIPATSSRVERLPRPYHEHRKGKLQQRERERRACGRSGTSFSSSQCHYSRGARVNFLRNS